MNSLHCAGVPMPGAGIVGSTIQFHGTADRYSLNGATSVATLYSNATTATTAPAVTLRSVGSSGGQAAAFTYDLARSVVYTRQGNPAWAGQERDGVSGIRPNDMFYGAKAGNQLTALLRQHILVAADLIAAAREGDQAAVVTQQQRWTANADRIATFLSKANPRFWKLGEMKAMMHDHLRLTTDEVVARLQGKWAADVRAYDRIHVQILHMADMLSDGLVGQFPARFD